MLRYLVLFALLPACVTLPSVGARATGEPLGVRSFTEMYTVTEQVKVGEVQHYSSDGSNLGRSAVYADQSRLVSRTKFRHYQGDSQLDEQDFFHIAGDLQAEKEIIDYRNNSVLMNKISWATVGVGAAMMIAGFIVNSTAGGVDQNGVPHSPGLGGYIVSGIGGLIGGTGIYLGFYARGRVGPDTPVFDSSYAQVAASSYNADLAKTAPTRTNTAPSDVPRKVPLTPVSKPGKRLAASKSL